MKQRTRISLDARGLIADEHLWTKGTIESTDDPPRRCLSGAICAATGIPEHEIETNPITADVCDDLGCLYHQKGDADSSKYYFARAKAESK